MISESKCAAVVQGGSLADWLRTNVFSHAHWSIQIMPCVAPSAFVTSDVAQAFGILAELDIRRHYLQAVGRKAIYPLSHIDFADFTEVYGNVNLYIGFLKANHSRLSTSQLATIAGERDMVKVPDIMTFDPPRRMEFYEIKPASESGLRKGNEKVALIDAMMAWAGLPYKPGTQYNPSYRVSLFKGYPLGARLEVWFQARLRQPGLITYEICAEGELEKLGLSILLSLLALIVVFILAAGAFAPVLLPALA